MGKKKAMELTDLCRTPVRRNIMALAEAAAQRQESVTATSLMRGLGYKDNSKLGVISYQVKVLREGRALKCIGGKQVRGAYQKHYVPARSFQATMTDTVALDQIAELLDSASIADMPRLLVKQRVTELGEIVKATGRPVEV